MSLNASVLIRNTPSHHIFLFSSLLFSSLLFSSLLFSSLLFSSLPLRTHFFYLQKLHCIRFIFGIKTLTFGERRIHISALWMSVRREAEREAFYSMLC